MCSQVLHGWRFWSVQGTEKPKAEPKPSKGQSARDRELYGELAPKREAKARAEKPAKKAPAKKKTAKKSPAKAMRANASDDSYGCGVCNETFPTQKAAVTHALTHTS